ncbi:MAG: DPP IV N-terminal domain-containing protein [Gemmataceae bacterium]|nr:DPP IV N-terminal domain-containing protein [Gemmataceae bacterium]
MQRLTQDGRMKMDPVFIKGGEELVYTLQESPTQMSLMRLKLADGSVERLHPQATNNEFEAAFTPDGRYYAFVQSKGNLNLKLVIRDTRQNKDAVFDPGGGFSGMRRPTFAPDGSRIVFSIPGNNGQQIHSVNAQGLDRKELTTSALNSWPAYSADGKYIAFGSNRDGDYDIYVMDAAGGNVRRLTKSPGMDLRPAWSPDGKQIAFTSNRDGNYEIYVMNADGSQPRRVTNNTERDDYATWHPDVKRLAIMAERAGKFDLYLVDVPA